MVKLQADNSVVDGGLPEGLGDAVADSLRNQRNWAWNVGIDAGWLYDSNIYLQQKAVSDQIFTPGCTLLGIYGDPEGALDATGQYRLFYDQYVDHPEESSLGQSLSLNSGWRPGARTSFLGSFAFIDSAGNGFDTGVQTRTITEQLSFGARYVATEKTTLGIDESFESSSYGGIGSTFNESTYAFFDYLVTPKVRVGLEGGGGWQSAAGVDESDTGARLRVGYDPADAVSVSANAGWQYETFSFGGSKGTPQIELAAKYTGLEETQIAISAYDRSDPTVGDATAQLSQVLGCTVSVTRAFRNNISATISGGYENASLDTPERGLTQGTQDTVFVRNSVTWTFRKRSSCSAFVQYVDRQSPLTAVGTNYDEVEVGIQASVLF